MLLQLREQELWHCFPTKRTKSLCKFTKRHATACLFFYLHKLLVLYRAENLRYQINHGQNIPPRFRQIVCCLHPAPAFEKDCLTRGFFLIFILSATLVIYNGTHLRVFSFICKNFRSSTAQKIFAISSSADKNSCRSFARLSACCWCALHASRISQIFFFTRPSLLHILCSCRLCSTLFEW